MWPISNAEGMSLDGYTFTVTNNCDTVVSYVVGLESVEKDGITNYLSDTSIALAFDNEYLGTYASLTNLEGPTANARGSKVLRTATVKGKNDVVGENVNTHNLKLWIDSESDVSEQGRGFAAKLFITGGQGIENDNPSTLTAESCFEMTNDGEIIGYNEELPECGESVTIPATVDGVAVKSIDTDAFKGKITRNVYQEYSDDGFVQVDSLDTSQADFSYVGEEGAELPSYFIVYNNTTEIVEWIEEQIGEMVSDDSIEIYYAGTDDIPTLNPGDLQMFAEYTAEDLIPIGIKTVISEKKLVVTSLDLSQAYNLEKIEEVAFSNFTVVDDEKDGCIYKNIDIVSVLDTEIVPTGLTYLKMGDQNELLLGTGVFGSLSMDEFTVYTNVKTYSNCYDDNGLALSAPFIFSNINKLNVSAINGNSIFALNADGPFSLSNLNDIVINEGVKEIGKETFNATAINSSITLPNSLEIINSWAFANTGGNENMTITIPDNVKYIGDRAFRWWKNTSTINFTRTESEVIEQVTLGEAWNNNAIVTYAQQ